MIFKQTNTHRELATGETMVAFPSRVRLAEFAEVVDLSPTWAKSRDFGTGWPWRLENGTRPMLKVSLPPFVILLNAMGVLPANGADAGREDNPPTAKLDRGRHESNPTRRLTLTKVQA